MEIAGHPGVSAYIKTLLVRLFDEGTYFWTSAFDQELSRLKRRLCDIQSVLNDASHMEVTNDIQSVLQHLCYDFDDVVDDLCYDLDGDVATKLAIPQSMATKVRKLIPKLLSPSKTLHPKLDGITTGLQRLEKQINELGLKDRKLKDTSSRRNETSLPEFIVVGRERQKEEFLSNLLRDVPSPYYNFSVVPIVGMGGLGKTTLARLLYNDTKVKDHFELMAWVTVSGFGLYEVSKAIFRSLTNVDSEFEDLSQLGVALAEKLQDKRFLLVVDDLWEGNYYAWGQLRHLFLMVAHGSRIIVTTRNPELVNDLGVYHIHYLECLSHEDSLSLLALHALGVDNFDSYPTLRSRGEDIVKMCGGLPLALKTVGSQMRTKKYREGWDDMLNSEMWDSQMADCILSALKLRYNNLPAHLKRLFAYCSLFPKGFLFEKEKLVQLWLAEGYINQSHRDEFRYIPEYKGLIFFEQLLSMSFFQHAPDHKSFFVMHDLINDLATSVAGDCFLLFEKQIGMVDGAFLKYRHMSFACEKYVGYKQIEALKRAKSLRTLLVVSAEVDNRCPFFYLPNKILDDILPHLPLLRVLSLSNCNICEVPDFIGSLKHLRYLNLSQTKIKELPENVGNLYCLRTLLVFGCMRLTKLPKSFLNLKKLRHFDMRGTPLLENMPLGISELKSLQTLPKIIIGGDNGFEITKLGGLTDLCGELTIEGLHKVKNPIHAQQAHLYIKVITKLVLKWGNVFNSAQRGTLEKEVLNELSPSCEMLKELAIVSYGGEEFPSWIGHPSFLFLTNVSIVDCRNCPSLPPLGSLPLLKKLVIKGMHGIKIIGSESGGSVIAFPSLETLVFEDMPWWKYWLNKGTTSDTSFPCLRVLQIKNCPKLIDVLLKAMPFLRVLQIGGCGHEVLRTLVQTAPSIAELEIESISGLTDVVWSGVIQYLGSVEDVSIKECNEMRYLWESEAVGSLALVKLRKLEVFGCSNLVSLGEKEAYDDRGTKFSYLRNLEVWFCGSMKRCSCPDKIERLTISSCSSLTHVSFPTGGQALKSLSIYGCHKLMERIDNTSMPMLASVDIRRWLNLKSISELNIGGFLTSLVIQDCQSLESFPGLLLLQLTCLTIADCQSLVSFPDLQLSKCKSLKHLEITNCPSIDASFPRGIWPPELCSLEIGGLQKPISEWGFQNFPTSLVCLKLHGERVRDFSQLSYLLPSSLTELHIQEFDELESLLMGLEHLTSLQHLSIYDCPKMKLLPEMLLPSLLTLEIFNCPDLKRRCSGRGSDYWPLISHIPCIDIQDGYTFI